MSDRLRVIVVDDHLADAEKVVDRLRASPAWSGAQFATATSCEDALRALDDRDARVIVMADRSAEAALRACEEQLRQARKMEAVGRLAGGIAHDFNNLLTAILGYSNLILDDASMEGQLRQDLEEIRSAGERAAALTRQLLEARLQATSAEQGKPTDHKRGWETVLLVEHEDAVRALACEVLERHGYVVLEARHGVDALGVAERHAADIHLMVTDLVMPHMSGRDLSERLAVRRPDMKVLFISSYTDHAAVHRDLTPTSVFLQKPFTPDALARKVRGVLDAKAT